MKENPFKYGKAVTGDDFIDRDEILNEITSDLISGQNLIICSNRRLGKSSLILEAFRKMEKTGVITVYIDMYSISSIKDLIESVIHNTISESYNQIEKIGKVASEFFKSLRPRFYLEEGQIGVEIYTEETGKNGLKESLNFPQRIAEKKGKQVIIAFDEFQEIMNLDGNQLEKTMRSVFQLHDDVSYVFAGSKTHLLKDIFENGNRPFYNFGKIKTLGKIPNKEFAKGIKRKFESTDRKISQSVIKNILDITEGHPYYTQQLCHELWYLSTDDHLNEKMVEKARKNILQYRSDFYEQEWSEIKSNIQRRLLIALADGVEDLYSEETVKNYNLKTSSHVQKAYKALESKDIVKDKKIIDIFFKSWIEDNLV